MKFNPSTDSFFLGLITIAAVSFCPSARAGLGIKDNLLQLLRRNPQTMSEANLDDYAWYMNLFTSGSPTTLAEAISNVTTVLSDCGGDLVILNRVLEAYQLLEKRAVGLTADQQSQMTQFKTSLEKAIRETQAVINAANYLQNPVNIVLNGGTNSFAAVQNATPLFAQALATLNGNAKNALANGRAQAVVATNALGIYRSAYVEVAVYQYENVLQSSAGIGSEGQELLTAFLALVPNILDPLNGLCCEDDTGYYWEPFGLCTNSTTMTEQECMDAGGDTD